MSYDRNYPPPPGLDRRNMSHLPPPPALRSDSGGGGRGHDRDRTRGLNRGGGWNGHEEDRTRNGRADSYHPLPPRPISPPRNGVAPPRSDFTFRAPQPASITAAQQTQQRGDSYMPRNNDRERRRAPTGPRLYQQNRPGLDRRGDRRGADRRGDRRGRGGHFGARFMASDRPILRQSHVSGGEAAQDFAKGSNGNTYLNLDDLSDSDETDMSISAEEGDGRGHDADGKPPRKRARIDGPAPPKWSNPDPYTVLPPTETGQQKKKDVVHLIRKARVKVDKASLSAPADTDEFISCDMDSDNGGGGNSENNYGNDNINGVGDDDDDDDEFVVIDDVDDYEEAIGQKRGRENEHEHGRGNNATDGVQRRGAVSHGSSGLSNSHSPFAAGSSTQSASNSTSKAELKAAAKVDKKAKSVSASASVPTAAAAASELNPSRKRTHDDQFKLPDHAKLKKVNMVPAGGFIVISWRVKDSKDSCPWLKDHSDTAVLATWLHKEIIDFYSHIKPRTFEQRLRQDLIDDLEHAVRKRFSNARIFSFGSFMSDLYLPTGDMDLVMCSTPFLNNRAPVFNKKGVLYKFGSFLCMNHMADREHLEHITKAKVPLVKYVDVKTWLKVDVSFENMTGVIAINTFKKWREQYPTMPILVTLIKQFLVMRGLNEPVNGGIGGFSIICLVVSMLQLMPPVQSQDMNADHNLGDLLMHFFDLYGNKFNYEATAIRLNPPGYVPKAKVANFIYKNVDRLSIIDPNNPQNDIAGGSKNTPAIMRAFSDAHDAIRRRIVQVASLPTEERRNQSLLGVILEGDYSSYREQREHMRQLYGDVYGKEPVD